jgi:hypothetical protein
VTPTHHALGLFRARLSQGLENVSRSPHLFGELGPPGFYERDIAKITSGKILGVLRRMEVIGGQLRKPRGVIVWCLG